MLSLSLALLAKFSMSQQLENVELVSRKIVVQTNDIDFMWTNKIYIFISFTGCLVVTILNRHIQ